MTSLQENLKKGFWADRTPSEKKLLKVLAALMPVLLVVLIIGLMIQSINEVEEEALRHRQTLDFIATAGPAWVERTARESSQQTHKDISEETLTDNSLALTSFVASHADAVGITVSSYDEDSLPFGGRGQSESIITERQLRVEIRNANMDNLIELLDRIEKAEEPVWIKRVNIQKQGRDDGVVRALVSVSTYSKRQES